MSNKKQVEKNFLFVTVGGKSPGREIIGSGTGVNLKEALRAFLQILGREMLFEVRGYIIRKELTAIEFVRELPPESIVKEFKQLVLNNEVQGKWGRNIID